MRKSALREVREMDRLLRASLAGSAAQSRR